jgi:Xaa-Pro dipeptidase
MTQLEKVQQQVADLHLDVAYLSDPMTINYLTGFGSDPHRKNPGITRLS